MSENASAAAAPEPAPASPPPGMGETLETAMNALLKPASTFGAASGRPAPSFGTAFGLALGCGAAAMAINLARVAIASPADLQRYPPHFVILVGVVGLAGYAAFVLMSAGVFFALGRMTGTRGDFDRAMQAVACVSVLGPAQALCAWFPVAWALPAVLAAWVSAGALEGLFGAGAWAARSICAVLAAGLIGAQAAARALAERATQAVAMAQAAGEMAGAMQSMQLSLQTPPGAADAPAAYAPPPGAPPAPALGGEPGAQPPAPSSLDMMRLPEDAQGIEDGPPTRAPDRAAPAQARDFLKASVPMLDSLTAMLSNPLLAQNMNSQQKQDLRELNGLLQKLRADAAGGRDVDEADFNRRMMKAQQLTMRMMSAGMGLPAGPQAAPARQPRRAADGR